MVVMLAMVNEGNGAIVVMVASAPRSTSSQKSSFHCLYTKTTLPWPWMEMGYNKCACKQRVEKIWGSWPHFGKRSWTPQGTSAIWMGVAAPRLNDNVSSIPIQHRHSHGWKWVTTNAQANNMLKKKSACTSKAWVTPSGWPQVRHIRSWKLCALVRYVMMTPMMKTKAYVSLLKASAFELHWCYHVRQAAATRAIEPISINTNHFGFRYNG